MIDFSKVQQYYIACGYTDLRRGIDGLAAIVSTQFQAELKEDSLFLFCGRRGDRIKALYFSGDAYTLLYREYSATRKVLELLIFWQKYDILSANGIG